MRKIFFGLVAVMILLSQTAQATPSPQWVKNLPAAQNANQIFVVACNDVSMHKLAQTLVDLGVDNAIYLIGGHNQKTFNGWWRDVDDDIELFRKTDEYTTYELESYIVWRKV